ncbi:MAG: TolC family protein [Opitutaceae bacterium]
MFSSLLSGSGSRRGLSLFAALLLSVPGLPAREAEPAATPAGDIPNEPRLITLSDAISMALDRNLQLKRSGVDVEIQQNQVEAARGNFQPNLTATASDTVRYAGSGLESVWDDGQWTNSLSAALSSAMILYNGGGNDASLARARADLEASRLDFDRDRQSILFQVVGQYLQAVLRLKEIDIQREELASRRVVLDRIKADVENGIRIQSEVLRQEAQVAISERLLAEAIRNYQTSLYGLKDLLLISPSESISCAIPPDRWMAAESLSEPDREVSINAAWDRVDLEAQRYRLEAAREDIRVARSGALPVVSALAGLRSGYNSRGYGDFGSQFGEYQPEVSGGLSIAIPIFDRKRHETDLVRSKLFLRQEEYFMEGLMQAAETDVLQAILDFNTSKIRLKAARDQLLASEAALEAEEARYEAGASTILDVNSLRTLRVEAAVAVEEFRFDLFVTRLGVTFQDGTIESFLMQTLAVPFSN